MSLAPPTCPKPDQSYLRAKREAYLEDDKEKMCTGSEFAAYRHSVEECARKKQAGEELTDADLDDLLMHARPIIEFAVLKQFKQAFQMAGAAMPEEQPTRRAMSCKAMKIQRVPLEMAVAAGKNTPAQARALIDINQDLTLKKDKSTKTPVGVLTVGAGTGGTVALALDPVLRPGRMGIDVDLTLSLLVDVMLEVADSISYNVPMCPCLKRSWCKSCKTNPPFKCCEAPDGCCIKPNDGYCWTEPYFTLQPHKIGAILPFVVRFDSTVLAKSPSLAGMVMGIATEPKLTLRATINCCRKWICFPLFQMLNCCLNAIVFPVLLNRLEESMAKLSITL